MSANVWTTIRDAVVSNRPDLQEEFKTCRNRESIVAFMNKYFPLEGKVKNPNWDDQLLIRIPQMMTEHFSDSREEIFGEAGGKAIDGSEPVS
jgi:hypothetical protein